MCVCVCVCVWEGEALIADGKVSQCCRNPGGSSNKTNVHSFRVVVELTKIMDNG